MTAGYNSALLVSCPPCHGPCSPPDIYPASSNHTAVLMWRHRFPGLMGQPSGVVPPGQGQAFACRPSPGQGQRAYSGMPGWTSPCMPALSPTEYCHRQSKPPFSVQIPDCKTRQVMLFNIGTPLHGTHSGLMMLPTGDRRQLPPPRQACPAAP